jgi:uncharacterized membrane protein
MNAYLLENLFHRLGKPFWFWPAVMVAILALMMVGGNDE